MREIKKTGAVHATPVGRAVPRKQASRIASAKARFGPTKQAAPTPTAGGRNPSKRAALHMEITPAALATFDALALRRGMSRPKLFAWLMAQQAQQMRLDDDIAQAREDQAAGRDDDPDLAAWLETNRVRDLG